MTTVGLLGLYRANCCWLRTVWRANGTLSPIKSLVCTDEPPVHEHNTSMISANFSIAHLEYTCMLQSYRVLHRCKCLLRPGIQSDIAPSTMLEGPFPPYNAQLQHRALSVRRRCWPTRTPRCAGRTRSRSSSCLPFDPVDMGK